MPPASMDRDGRARRDGTDAGVPRVGAERLDDLLPTQPRYRAEGTLTIRNKNDIVVEGNGATFFATQVSNVRTEAQWVIADVSNIEFSDLKIRGTHTDGGQDDEAYFPEREAQHGLLVQGGERILVHDLDITDVYGDFIYVGRSAIGGHPTNVFVYDNYMRRNGRQGISVIDGTNVLIESNDIADTRRATFDLEPLPGWWVDNVWIRNNKVGPGRLMFVAGHGAGALNDVHIVNNVLTGKAISIDMVAPDGTRRRTFGSPGTRATSPTPTPRGVHALRELRQRRSARQCPADPDRPSHVDGRSLEFVQRPVGEQPPWRGQGWRGPRTRRKLRLFAATATASE